MSTSNWIEVSPQDALKFWEHLEKKYPEIDSQLSTRTLVDSKIISFQPAKMSNDDYEIYNRILNRWLIENNFKPNEPDYVYVSTNDEKGMAIDTSLITTVESEGVGLSKVFIKNEDSDLIESVTIKEEAEAFKKRAYLFRN